MKNLLALFSILLLSVSCECEDDKKSSCKSQDPIDQSWFEELKSSLDNCSCQTSIMKGTYKGSKTIFFVLMNDPLCNGVGAISLFDCSGKLITMTKDIHEFVENVHIDSTLYTCED